MSVDEVRAMPLPEKLEIMEAIWENFRERFETLEIPAEHRDLLDSRRDRVESGEVKLLDWDEVKSALGRR